MQHRSLAKLALDRDIGGLEKPKPGMTIGIGESGTKTSSSRVYTTLIPVFFSNKRPTR